MPQIEFDGKGDPIPKIALPPFGGGSALPPTVLIFTDNVDFPVDQYRGLGFTHFEVWCVGASGGRGGGVQIIDPSDPTYGHGAIPSTSYGGEGGGGGLHKVSGLLEDLPDIAPVVVGKQGANGADGNRHYRWRVASALQEISPGIWQIRTVNKGATNIPGMVDGAGNAISPYFYVDYSNYLNFLNPDYLPPQDGVDGGASSFYAPLCRASGGKGGKKSPVYSDSSAPGMFLTPVSRIGVYMPQSPGGEGGQGGVGNSVVAGGGGDGGKSSALEFNDVPGTPGYGQPKPYIYTEAKDGSWNGTIGQGGGGGLGGTNHPNTGHPSLPTPPPTIRLATKGGRGSFSYGDTSVYGQAGYYASQIVPGTGGGARPSKNLKVGSRTAGYSPDGIVVVRLTRIV